LVEADSKDKDKRTPLSWAAERGHGAVVKLLVEKGADVKSKDTSYGQTPLLRAAANGHEAAVKLLVEKGGRRGVQRYSQPDAASCGLQRTGTRRW
jgi:ankyrin repeat protein